MRAGAETQSPGDRKMCVLIVVVPLTPRHLAPGHTTSPIDDVYDNSPLKRPQRSRIITDKNGRVSLLLDTPAYGSSVANPKDTEEVYGLAKAAGPTTERPVDGVYANPTSLLRKQPENLDGVYFNSGGGDPTSGSLLYGRVGDDAIGSIPGPPPSSRQISDEHAPVYGLALRPPTDGGGYYANPDSLLRQKSGATEGQYFNDGGVSTEVGLIACDSQNYGRTSDGGKSELSDNAQSTDPGGALAGGTRLVGPEGQHYYAWRSDPADVVQSVAPYMVVGDAEGLENLPLPQFVDDATPKSGLSASPISPLDEGDSTIGTIISLQNLYGMKTRGSGRQFLSGQVNEDLYASPSKYNMVRPKRLSPGHNVPGDAGAAGSKARRGRNDVARLSEPPALPVRLSQVNPQSAVARPASGVL